MQTQPNWRHARQAAVFKMTLVCACVLQAGCVAQAAPYQIALNAPIAKELSVAKRGLVEFDGSTPAQLSGLVNQGYLIRRSHVVLDCKGAVLDGRGIVPTGVLIDSEGQPIEDITIKNCTFKNFRYNGMRIGWTTKDVLKAKQKTGDLYQYHPKNIKIINVKVIDSGTAGIYVDDYVDGVTIEQSTIRRSGDVGIYLEFSSRNNKLMNNVIAENGFGLAEKKKSREGVAVDSSYQNVIKGNRFYANAGGGVFLYRNCQEHISTGEAAPRLHHADHNLITDNVFLQEKIGVWVASRQSKDLKAFDCGIPALYKNSFYPDYADHNQVERNIFCDVAQGVIVEGDDNQVINNQFFGNLKAMVNQPITARQKYANRPPVGNRYVDNLLGSQRPATCQLTWPK